VHVVLVDFGERHRHTDKRGQHYTATDRRPTNQVSAWQAERGSRHARNPRLVADILATMSRGCYAEHVPVESKPLRTFCRWHCSLEMASLVCCMRALNACVTHWCWFQMSVAHAFSTASISLRSFMENSRRFRARSRFSCVNCCQLTGSDTLRTHTHTHR